MIAHKGKSYDFWKDLIADLDGQIERLQLHISGSVNAEIDRQNEVEALKADCNRYKDALKWIAEKCQGTVDQCACNRAKDALRGSGK
jgi:hypothetical protein